MAETMTYDPGTDTITTENSLTPDEQESLKVGEELEAQQETLLAGKYRTAEELERAYGELEKKLGEKGNQDSETTNETEVSESDEVSEEKEEAKETSPAVSLINEASEEYWSNDKELSPETMEKFNSMSSQDLLAAYLEVQKNAPAPEAAGEEAPDLSDADVNVIKNSAGGEQEYENLINWASTNLPQNEIDSFDDLVSTGNVGAIKLAVNGLKSKYEFANGYEGTMVTGKAPKAAGDVFRSQQELVAAMSDPRYDADPAYRQDVIEKLERSDNVKF